jgi:hypothetical protein
MWQRRCRGARLVYRHRGGTRRRDGDADSRVLRGKHNCARRSVYQLHGAERGAGASAATVVRSSLHPSVRVAAQTLAPSQAPRSKGSSAEQSDDPAATSYLTRASRLGRGTLVTGDCFWDQQTLAVAFERGGEAWCSPPLDRRYGVREMVTLWTSPRRVVT